MTCKEAENKLFAYLSGQLSGKEQEQIRRALEKCPSLKSKMDILEAIDNYMDYEASLEPDPGINSRIMAAINKGNPKAKVRDFGYSKWQAVAIAALIILGLFLGNLLGKTYVSTLPGNNVVMNEDYESELFVSYDQLDTYFLLNEN